ncbi:Aldo/keto reductase [Mycena maculata]|uniref:Aldo/keto reductase n=1 Tax=Mycena maculata TaxID=230809 RepID=A0AAD7IN27_9AGAR|nr:Aldo/keto reductase [Mycena maculata]
MSPTRSIGNPAFPTIGSGAMGISTFYESIGSDEERFQAAGCTFWDTADIYGESEELIGEWCLQTSFQRGYLAYPRCVGSGAPKSSSLRNLETFPSTGPGLCGAAKLGVETIDLYYLHRTDAKMPIDHTVGATAGLVNLSEVSASTFRRTQAVHSIAAVQVEYSPFTLDIEDPNINLLNTTRESRRQDRRVLPLGAAFADGLKEIGTKYNGVTGGQVAIAWLLAQGDNTPSPSLGRRESRGMAVQTDVAQEERHPPGMLERMFVETPAREA